MTRNRKIILVIGILAFVGLAMYLAIKPLLRYNANINGYPTEAQVIPVTSSFPIIGRDEMTIIINN